MRFTSPEFILIFFPVVFIIFFLLNQNSFIKPARLWIIGASLLFYSTQNTASFPVLLLSLLWNFCAGILLSSRKFIHSKKILTCGIIGNLCFLAFFKYSDFLILSVNTLFSADFPVNKYSFPMAISFFTFTQISYIVDVFHNGYGAKKFIDYSYFVCFFPKMLAGPIVRYSEIIGQLLDHENKLIHKENICKGICLFALGLFYHSVIADMFAVWTTKGFNHIQSLTLIEAWITSLSYTFQIYFEFSGYSDMAIGIALFFNIKLPDNFNSPYKARNIREFWRCWHMTLTRFFTQYIYIPLGGNKAGERRMLLNIFIVCLLSGIWHGEGWTFFFWGGIHATALVIHRLWRKADVPYKNKFISWSITFLFVNFSWIFFRSSTIQNAFSLMSAMFGCNGVALPDSAFLISRLSFVSVYNISFTSFFLSTASLIQSLILICAGCVAAMKIKNSKQIVSSINFNTKTALVFSLLIIFSFVYILYFSGNTDFIYFNF